MFCEAGLKQSTLGGRKVNTKLAGSGTNDERAELEALRAWKQEQSARDAEAHRANLETAARSEARAWAGVK
jgi:hypothetical protein